jgi:23S rRNA (cytosine1962-C5)-methyltransferase
MLPCVNFEDEDLLVINKPAGMNTHAPSLYAGEGLYEWLRCREPRWANLAIIHRLDKETSGLILFAKTRKVNRSLTEQFARRRVKKRYSLLTDRLIGQKKFQVTSSLIRVGEKYVSRPQASGGETAVTRFRVLDQECSSTYQAMQAAAPTRDPSSESCVAWLAEPLTGRTHQIRVHASENGLPILGDELYGGTPAARVYLHATEMSLKHPGTQKEITFHATPNFAADPRLELREALVEQEFTNAYRLVHGASDGWPGGYLDRLNEFILSQSETALSSSQLNQCAQLTNRFKGRGAYHKLLRRQLRAIGPDAVSARLILGEMAAPFFVVRENGLQYELSFDEGYSTGLFLDQRENRRRLLTGHIAPNFVLPSYQANGTQRDKSLSLLNTFSYTCAFSVCAARAGMKTTSVDLSKTYLEWGKRNFSLNQLSAENHEFVWGDVFDQLRRFGKRSQRFDVIVLDPPTFSQSKSSGPFRVEKDYGKLIQLALPLLLNEGILFASTNALGWRPEDFLKMLISEISKASRKVLQHHFVPQPPDFPISRAEPAYLKTVWLRIGSPRGV